MNIEYYSWIDENETLTKEEFEADQILSDLGWEEAIKGERDGNIN